jgi:hypothetical protein
MRSHYLGGKMHEKKCRSEWDISYLMCNFLPKKDKKHLTDVLVLKICF